MLWNVPIPISSGFSSVMQNIGKIQNKGIEFSINSINIEQKILDGKAILIFHLIVIKFSI